MLMLRILRITSLFLFLSLTVNAQNSALIKRMSWEANFKIKLEMKNDSVHIMDVENLFHSSGEVDKSSPVYYPVSLSESFISQLKGKDFEAKELEQKDPANKEYATLWSSVHSQLGGGWQHFLNCFLFSLETNKINITSQLMKRHESNWKPNPVTESYRRTKKWKYYVPVSQKNAIKEYKIREKKGELGDILQLPPEFIEVFLNTSQKEYDKMNEGIIFKDKAKIDLIKILLGANYLSKTQITYLTNGVLGAALNYSSITLPTVIILDDLDAAIAMTLSVKGYQIEKIVFRSNELISYADEERRINTIYSLINQINETNNQLYQEKLKLYYQK